MAKGGSEFSGQVKTISNKGEKFVSEWLDRGKPRFVWMYVGQNHEDFAQVLQTKYLSNEGLFLQVNGYRNWDEVPELGASSDYEDWPEQVGEPDEKFHAKAVDDLDQKMFCRPDFVCVSLEAAIGHPPRVCFVESKARYSPETRTASILRYELEALRRLHWATGLEVRLAFPESHGKDPGHVRQLPSSGRLMRVEEVAEVCDDHPDSSWGESQWLKGYFEYVFPVPHTAPTFGLDAGADADSAALNALFASPPIKG